MAELKQYCIVRLVKMSRSPNKYVVENVGNDGKTIWLSDFFADEIEPIDFPGIDPK